jgi:hypothetical protein
MRDVADKLMLRCVCHKRLPFLIKGPLAKLEAGLLSKDAKFGANRLLIEIMLSNG